MSLTPDEQAVTSLVTQKERLDEVIISNEIERQQLELYLIDTLGEYWFLQYYRWRDMHAKELKKHRAEREREYRQ